MEDNILRRLSDMQLNGYLALESAILEIRLNLNGIVSGDDGVRQSEWRGPGLTSIDFTHFDEVMEHRYMKEIQLHPSNTLNGVKTEDHEALVKSQWAIPIMAQETRCIEEG
jgi:hypothetical protein